MMARRVNNNKNYSVACTLSYPMLIGLKDGKSI